MTQEIDLGGTIYISSRRAAEITGYAQDYIGQLARSGAIDARRVAGLWYVQEDSLRNHKEKADEYKPIPPQRADTRELESSVSFDGKDYISAARAARITGYSQDYVGQLARSEKILSRQIGNRWYVDREAIVAHKKHNDSLLAAVQTDSVGLVKEESSEIAQNAAQDEENLLPHYTYIQEDVAPMPQIQTKEEQMIDTLDDTSILHDDASVNDHVVKEQLHQIPIRVIEPKPVVKRSETVPQYSPAKKTSAPRITIFLLVFLVVASATGAGLVYMERTSRGTEGVATNVLRTPASDTASNIIASAGIYIANFAPALLSKELEYRK